MANRSLARPSRPDAGRFVMNSDSRSALRRRADLRLLPMPAETMSATSASHNRRHEHDDAQCRRDSLQWQQLRVVEMTALIYAAGLPDGSGRVVIAERGGRIRLEPIDGTFEATDFLNIATQVNTSGERGLLSIAFSPNFLVDRTFYVFFYPLSSNVTEIRKYTTTGSSYAEADAATADTILTIAQGSAGNHTGGTVFFDNAGRLLISLGDGGNTRHWLKIQ
jgi:glucose/arabinose dehydrogenase